MELISIGESRHLRCLLIEVKFFFFFFKGRFFNLIFFKSKLIVKEEMLFNNLKNKTVFSFKCKPNA